MSKQQIKPVEFFMPPITVIGSGAIQELPERVVSILSSKPLLVTDKGMTKLGVTQQITDILTKGGIEYAIYDETIPNPTDVNVVDGLAMYQSNGCDCIITLGGGSAHDCGKGIGLLATNGGRIQDYEGVEKSKKRMPGFIAINTTAGTASEMTRFCIITDSVRKVKMAIVDRRVTPRVAINDPDLMVGLPSGLTAATGMDALTHAVEAYVSIGATHMTDANAEKAIKLICKYLRRAVGNGRNLEAREAMCYAQYQAGMAFNNAGLGYVHAMAHQLGGFLNLPHGECNAILLPYVCEYNMISCMDKFAEMAELFGVAGNARTQRELALSVVQAIRDLMQDINIAPNLTMLAKKYGKTVDPNDFEIMAENAMKDACATTNPRSMNKSDIIAIFHQIL